MRSRPPWPQVTRKLTSPFPSLPIPSLFQIPDPPFLGFPNNPALVKTTSRSRLPVFGTSIMGMYRPLVFEPTLWQTHFYNLTHRKNAQKIMHKPSSFNHKRSVITEVLGIVFSYFQILIFQISQAGYKIAYRHLHSNIFAYPMTILSYLHTGYERDLVFQHKVSPRVCEGQVKSFLEYMFQLLTY